MDPDEWRRLVQRIDVRAPLPAVYAAWATAEGLMGWFPMEAVITDARGKEREPGAAATTSDRFRFSWPTGHAEAGEFLEADGPRRLRFTFGRGIQVSVGLEEAEGGDVMVTLEQTQERSDEENLQVLLGFKEGWAFYLTNLKSVLEGGLDLRSYHHPVDGRVNY